MYVVVKELIAIYGKWDEKIPYYALEDATFPYSADSELIVYVKGSSRIESGTCKVKIELYDGVTNDLSIEGLKYLVGKAVSVPTDEKGDFEKLAQTCRPVQLGTLVDLLRDALQSHQEKHHVDTVVLPDRSNSQHQHGVSLGAEPVDGPADQA